MEQHINFITLGVTDLNTSRRFYQDVFGWQLDKNSNDNIAFFQTGNALMLALFARDELAKDAQVSAEPCNGFPRFTLTHNVGSEHEVDALFEQFVKQGVEIVKQPQKVFWGGIAAISLTLMVFCGKSLITRF